MSDLLRRLGVVALLSDDELANLIRSAPHRYKVFRIPKRKAGEFRTIAQPAREVKILQYWVMRYVLARFAVHPAATAYRKGLSIADNAEPHVRGRFLLKLDFRDFFPSIRARDVKMFLRRRSKALDESDIDALCKILLWIPEGSHEHRLSIGAPSSPMLSNILLREFDQKIAAACKRERVRYTRYADDLSFSAGSSRQLATIERVVFDVCARQKSPALVINVEKTARVSRRESRKVTGLILTNDGKVSIGRDMKRRIRASMHHFVTRRLAAKQTQELQGMLAFVNSVEPDFMHRLKYRYGDAEIQRCLRWRGDE